MKVLFTSSLDRLGVGLWTMQSTAASPGNPVRLYRDFADDAVLADRLGFHSIWTAEHRLWYDGWCPAPLHAQAFAAARTERIRFANSVLLLPQHDPVAFAETVATLDRLSGGRVILGLGLGYRDAEYDALGIERTARGRRMDAALDVLDRAVPPRPGSREAGRNGLPPILVGGMTDAAIARAARRGHGLILPQTMTPPELETTIYRYREQAERTATVAVMRDAWVASDRRSDAFRRAMARHYREEIGSWWVLKGSIGFARPERIERQLERIGDCALIGTPRAVAEGLDEIFAAGADLVSIRICFDFVARDELHEQMSLIATEVAPLLDGTAIAG